MGEGRGLPVHGFFFWRGEEGGLKMPDLKTPEDELHYTNLFALKVLCALFKGEEGGIGNF